MVIELGRCSWRKCKVKLQKKKLPERAAGLALSPDAKNVRSTTGGSSALCAKSSLFYFSLDAI